MFIQRGSHKLRTFKIDLWGRGVSEQATIQECVLIIYQKVQRSKGKNDWDDLEGLNSQRITVVYKRISCLAPKHVN